MLVYLSWNLFRPYLPFLIWTLWIDLIPNWQWQIKTFPVRNLSHHYRNVLYSKILKHFERKITRYRHHNCYLYFMYFLLLTSENICCIHQNSHWVGNITLYIDKLMEDNKCITYTSHSVWTPLPALFRSTQ